MTRFEEVTRLRERDGKRMTPEEQAARIAELEAQVAALKEIAVEERAAVLACFEDAYGVTEEHRLEARRQLAKEHLEAFR